MMVKKNSDYLIWIFVILIILASIGLIYLMAHIPALPLFFLCVLPIVSFLIYEEKLPKLNRKYNQSLLLINIIVVFYSCLIIIFSPYSYVSFLSRSIVDGRQVTRIVTMQADEGPNTWEESRTYWEPYSQKGERVMDFIGWFIIILGIISTYCTFRFWKKNAEEEEKEKLKDPSYRRKQERLKSLRGLLIF